MAHEDELTDWTRKRFAKALDRLDRYPEWWSTIRKWDLRYRKLQDALRSLLVVRDLCLKAERPRDA